MAQKVVDVTIRGIASLLQHRFPDDAKPDNGEAVRVGGKRDYSDQVEKALYRNPDGSIYQPASHIEGAMVKAATKFQIGGRGKKTYKDLFKSGIVVGPEAIPLKFETQTVDRRSVIINRGRIMRERPKFDTWELNFEITIMDDQLPVKVVNQVLVEAGQYQGIGDYRPKFGRFMVTKFEEK